MAALKNDGIADNSDGSEELDISWKITTPRNTQLQNSIGGNRSSLSAVDQNAKLKQQRSLENAQQHTSPPKRDSQQEHAEYTNTCGNGCKCCWLSYDDMTIAFKMSWPNSIARTVRWGICGTDNRYMHLIFTSTASVPKRIDLRIQITITHTAAIQTTICPQCGRVLGRKIVPEGRIPGTPVIVSKESCLTCAGITPPSTNRRAHSQNPRAK